jgi:hypothetical protein
LVCTLQDLDGYCNYSCHAGIAKLNIVLSTDERSMLHSLSFRMRPLRPSLASMFIYCRHNSVTDWIILGHFMTSFHTLNSTRNHLIQPKFSQQMTDSALVSAIPLRSKVSTKF